MKVIITNGQLKNISNIDSYTRRGVMIFSNASNINSIVDRLLVKGFKEVDLEVILEEKRKNLRQTIIDFCGDLNSNATHHNWWAINLSRREQTYLFPNGLAKIFLLKTVIDSNNYDLLVVLDSSIYPWTFLRNEQIKVDLQFRLLTNWKDEAKRLLPIWIILWLIKKICIKTKLGWKNFKLKEKSSKQTVMLFTLINQKCFHNGSFRDVYLGDLAKYIQSDGRQVFVIGQLIGWLSSDLLFNINQNKDFPIYLIDRVCSLKDIVEVTKQVFYDFFRPVPKWETEYFLGFNIKKLIDSCLKWDLQSSYAEALLSYKAAKKCLEQIHVDTFIYPFENKCIERMLLIALREVCPNARAVGYQHSVLTPKHIHMFMTEGEADVMPLPDRIVTNGPWTAKMLKERGHYPQGKIVAGTALRFSSQNNESAVRQKPPEKVHNVLVALAEGAEEYDRAFSFLRALQDNSPSPNFSFRVRLHPSIPYDPFKKQGCGKNCIRDKEPSLEKSLQQADILLYASTSVAVHAMSLGIPVVWMDLLDFWGTDPVEGDELLRWELINPAGWDAVVRDITLLSEKEFQRRLSHSMEFAKGYFCQDPVDVSVFFGNNS